MQETEFHDDPTDGSAPLGTVFLHDITKLDCAVFDPAKGVVGQTWKVDVTLTGPLGTNGFVYDFGLVKKMVRQTLKSSLDHALIIPINSQAVQFKGMERGERWRMRSKAMRGELDLDWEYMGPSGAIFPLRCVSLNRQTIEQEFSRQLRHRLPQELTHVVVALREEELLATEAVFRYSHGIAGHAGMCQRLFHGHRSRLQIHVGDERRPDLEHYVARDVLGTTVHIATPSQFRSGMVEPGTRGKTREPVILGYEGSLGYYEAMLPAERVFCVETETSIECIVQELARLVKREENTGEKVKVVCYEGADKGAIAVL